MEHGSRLDNKIKLEIKYIGQEWVHPRTDYLTIHSFLQIFIKTQCANHW